MCGRVPRKNDPRVTQVGMKSWILSSTPFRLRSYKIKERRWYIFNHIYAWTVPCVMTSIVAVRHAIKPSIGVTTCWFHRTNESIPRELLIIFKRNFRWQRPMETCLSANIDNAGLERVSLLLDQFQPDEERFFARHKESSPIEVRNFWQAKAKFTNCTNYSLTDACFTWNFSCSEASLGFSKCFPTFSTSIHHRPGSGWSWTLSTACMAFSSSSFSSSGDGGSRRNSPIKKFCATRVRRTGLTSKTTRKKFAWRAKVTEHSGFRTSREKDIRVGLSGNRGSNECHANQASDLTF